jgi:hypothetical protein
MVSGSIRKVSKTAGKERSEPPSSFYDGPPPRSFFKKGGEYRYNHMASRCLSAGKVGYGRQASFGHRAEKSDNCWNGDTPTLFTDCRSASDAPFEQGKDLMEVIKEADTLMFKDKVK